MDSDYPFGIFKLNNVYHCCCQLFTIIGLALQEYEKKKRRGWGGGKMDIPTHKYMTAHFPGVGTGTPIKSGGVKLVLWTETFPL
jgi:hypothetical protein